MMANNGPFCKGIENNKGNIFESELWEKTFDVRFFFILAPFSLPTILVKRCVLITQIHWKSNTH